MKDKFNVGQVVRDMEGRFYVIARIDMDGKLYVANGFARGTVSEISNVRPLTKREAGR